MTRTRSSSTVAEQSTRAFDETREHAELLARCEELAQRALAGGADEAEAFAVRGETIAVRFEKGDLKLTQVDDGASLGLRVFRERRLGFASTNQCDERSLATTARDALTLAGFARPDEFNRLPQSRPIRREPSLVEPALAELGVERAVELGRDFLSRVQRIDPRLSIDNAGCEVRRATRAVHSSRGAHATESDAELGFNVFGMAIDGDDVAGFHYDGDALRRLSDVEPAMERCAREFASIALGNLKAGPAESYRGPVLFAPDAFLDVFVAPLVSAASAIAVQRKRSPLAGKLNERIAAVELDIHDDPTDRSLSGATAFDREGQPTARIALVERGMLKTFLYNGYAAAVDGRASTGHASGGARSVPGLGAHAIAVGAGSGGDRAAMLASLGRGLYVQRFSGSVDAASGDFSGVAKSARWIENGQFVRSVRETLFSGNVFELLKEIALFSSVRERCSGAALAPYALVEGIGVTAG
jgi:PmbA protein